MCVYTGAAGGEEGQPGGVQGGEGASGEAAAEPAHQRPGPEALVAAVTLPLVRGRPRPNRLGP